mmetsp:Transcript_11886/g.25111  ORF Transcript_11886/g.25111 Transcript_11886/m.25111 type:complete len:269 (+) Transcript_11886:842-1648(+)
MWYFSMATLRDDDTSKHGTVGVLYNFDDAQVDMSCFERLSQLEFCWPHRQLGAHICYNQKSLRPLVTGYRLFRQDRFRIQTHFGSLEEVHLKLTSSFGIDMDRSPMRPDHSWSLDFHHEWLRKLLREEESLKSTCTGSPVAPIVPREMDVLFGKSIRARSAPGTRRALHLVEHHYEEYTRTSSKYDKKACANGIIAQVHASGGRFLKSDREGWMEVDDITSRQKIAHWFRYMKTKSADAANRIPVNGRGLVQERGGKPTSRQQDEECK